MGLKFDIEKLIKPYRKGGTPDDKVERNLSTIATKLIVGNKLPVEVVGAAIFKVLNEMACGLMFKGDGTYGSRGREMFCCIKAQAIELSKKEATEAVVAELYKKSVCVRYKCPKRLQILKGRPNSRKERFLHFWLRPRGLWRL